MSTRERSGALTHELTSLLRADGRYAIGRRTVPWVRLCSVVTTSGLVYGFAMGSLEARLIGALYSALKVPLLLTFSILVCLPNFYVMNLILGLREDFGAALRAILTTQGALALTLASLAPVTWLFYACRMTYPVALLWNASVFALASAAGQVMLARHYRPLIAQRPRHRHALFAWFVLYVFVGVKIGWVLRPFVGDPALPTTFLREECWQDNPYANLLWTVVGLGMTIVRKISGDG